VELPASPRVRDALAAAMRQLARRERLSAELQRALEAKGFEKEAI
jgi:SOS response regulatory protein OraA/RecX